LQTVAWLLLIHRIPLVQRCNAKQITSCSILERKRLRVMCKAVEFFANANICYRGFGKCNAFWSNYLGIWTYFESNYAYENIHYVEIPRV